MRLSWTPRCPVGFALITQPRIEQRDEKVDRDVDQDEDDGEHQHEPCISGRSRLITASIAMLPMPG